MEFGLTSAIMTDLNSLLASKASLKRVVERYRAKLALAQKELDEIEAVLSIVKKYGGEISDSLPSPPKTVGDMATELLKEYPEGLTSMELLHLIRERWMPELMRSSISPPLSRLKHMGIVELDNSVWRLTQNTAGTTNITSRNHSIQISVEAQKIAEQSLQTIMQKQNEILSQIILNATLIDKEAAKKYQSLERIEYCAEMARKTYEITANKLFEVGHDNRVESCKNTTQLSEWARQISDNSNLNKLDEITSVSRNNSEYRRKRAL